MFLNTKVKGLKIPFHINFEEINLRFYVRNKDGSELKRGVVFVKEIVSKSALTFVANTMYKEKYETLPTEHTWTTTDESLIVEYKWKKDKWNTFRIVAGNDAEVIKEGSEEEFITEHYWGYTKINDAQTSEYGVEHPKWGVYTAKDYFIEVDFGIVYGKDFEFLNNQIPKSVFLAEGSEIKVKKGKFI
jgi:uncharacterized protein YqjF (DUF2071 family)